MPLPAKVPSVGVPYEIRNSQWFKDLNLGAVEEEYFDKVFEASE